MRMPEDDEYRKEAATVVEAMNMVFGLHRVVFWHLCGGLILHSIRSSGRFSCPPFAGFFISGNLKMPFNNPEVLPGGVCMAAFLDMLAFSEGTDNGRQPTRNHGYDVIVGGGLFTDYADHPRQRVYIPRISDWSTAAGRYQLLARYFDVYKRSLGCATSGRRRRMRSQSSRSASVVPSQTSRRGDSPRPSASVETSGRACQEPATVSMNRDSRP